MEVLSYFSSYVRSGPASTVHPQKILGILSTPPNKNEILATPKISPILYLNLLLCHPRPSSGLEDGEQIDAILLDFSKAFDKVTHQRLLLHLQQYGIRGQLLSWIGSFLTGRSQKVHVEGKHQHMFLSYLEFLRTPFSA